MKVTKIRALLFLAFWMPGAATFSQQKAADSDRWETKISEFEAADKKNPPPKKAILFIGSSSIVYWKERLSFPELVTINRGFGGSHTSDSLKYADRIILPYEPKIIVFYAGDNDIKAGKPAERAADDFAKIVAKVHKTLPDTQFLYIAIKPSISRWSLVGEMRKANKMIQKFCKKDERLTFVDIDKPMMGKDGKPNPELFVEDGLHINVAGYILWTEILRPYLGRAIGRIPVTGVSAN